MCGILACGERVSHVVAVSVLGVKALNCKSFLEFVAYLDELTIMLCIPRQLISQSSQAGNSRAYSHRI